MPISPETAGSISAGIDRTSSILAAGNANRKQRKWNEKMMAQQRAWSLEDWHRQNQYNSPAAQMQRFKEAGLNPNLIYGQTNEAAPVRSTDAPDYNPRSIAADIPQFPNIMAQSQDLRQQQMQTDLMAKDLELKEQQKLRMQVETAVAAQSLTDKQLEYSIKNSLKDTTVEFEKEKLRGVQIGNRNAVSENERRNIYTAASTYKTMEGILTLQAQRTVIPFQRQLIQAQIKSLQENTSLTQLKQYAQEKDNAMKDDIHQSIIVKRMLDGQKLTTEEVQTEIKRLEAKFKNMGLSPTVTSDILKSLFGIGMSLTPKNAAGKAARAAR